MLSIGIISLLEAIQSMKNPTLVHVKIMDITIKTIFQNSIIRYRTYKKRKLATNMSQSRLKDKAILENMVFQTFEVD